MSVTGTVSPIIQFINTVTSGTAGILNERVLPGNPIVINWTPGTSSGELDLLWSTTQTITGTTTFDLTSLTSSTGSAVNFARVKYFLAWNHDDGTDANVITIGGGSNNWTGMYSGTVTVAAGGFFEAGSPYATGFVVSGTSKIVQVATPSAIETTIIFAGCSV